MLAIFLINILTIVTSDIPNEYKAPGYFDLSYVDFSGNVGLRLDGEWEFYPDRIIEPGDFESYTPVYRSVPELNAKKYRYYDSATYRVVLKIKDGYDHLGFTIPSIFTDSRIIVNGETVLSTGSFNGSSSTFPSKEWRIIHPTSQTVEIVVQVKNCGYALPGLDGRFEIGSISFINSLQTKRFAFDLAFTILPLFIGIFFIFIFIYTKALKKYLYFGLLCFAFTARMAMINEVLLLQFFPNIPFDVGYSLKTISVPLIVAGTLRIAMEYANKFIPKPLIYSSYGVSALYILALLFFPCSVSSYVTPVFLLVIVLIVSVFSVLMFVCALSQVKNAVYAYAGFISIAACSIHDCLNYMRVIKGDYILGYAFFAYVTIYSFLMAKTHSEAYHRAQRLSEGLRRALDRAEQTETAYMNAQMKPHFLFNTLNTIAEYCTVNPSEAERLILVLAKYLRKTIDYGSVNSTVPLEKEIQHVKEYIEIISSRFQDVEFVYDIPDALPPAEIPPMILQPLIENCVNHGIRYREGDGLVEIGVVPEGDYIRISVTDNGTGITPKRLETILNYPDDTGRIGLYNVDHRLKREFGEGINIETELCVGTKMNFRIPVQKDKENTIDQGNNGR
ncbi:MAG: histidine kinase [Clostridia bacterium]|nr:histidine kinase [Clostridia bacterium]